MSSDYTGTRCTQAPQSTRTLYQCEVCHENSDRAAIEACVGKEWPEVRNCPAFWRSVKALRDAKIQPFLMGKGGKMVQFDEEPPDLFENCGPDFE